MIEGPARLRVVPEARSYLLLAYMGLSKELDRTVAGHSI